MENTILIIDFGSSRTQRIAQEIRALNIYCEIFPFNHLPANLATFQAIVLSDCKNEGISVAQIRKELPELPGGIPILAVNKSRELIEGGDRITEISSENFPETAKDLKELKTFLLTRAEAVQNWTPKAFVNTTVRELRDRIGADKVVLGLSGGVDSSVTAVLLNKAIGENLYCIFVNHGLLRKNEFTAVLEQYKDMGLNVKGIDASQRFLNKLSGVTDPEKKRKIIGGTFIEVFEEEAQKIQGVKYLGQGTIYPDIIESVSWDGKVSVKSHHNVGGLPERMNLKLVEPLRSLFKDEVRRVGKELQMKSELIGRHPFPGPGLGIRILGAITAEKVHTIQEADAIFVDNLRAAGLYDKVWQAGAILLPINSVGKAKDQRTYERVVALRCVNSTNGMTADWVNLPYEFLQKVSNEIIQNVEGVNRVVLDISSKPPATIEWE